MNRQSSDQPAESGDHPPNDAHARDPETPDGTAEVRQMAGKKSRSDGQDLTTSQESHGPARGYSWPPFEEGNTVALVHGASSPRAIAAKAAEVHQELLEHAPYLAEPRFLPAVNRYLQAAAREALLHGHIESVSAERGPGAVPSRVWEQATAAARLAAKLGSDLGLDPLGHAKIRSLSAGAGVAEASLEDLAERGRRLASGRPSAALSATEDDR